MGGKYAPGPGSHSPDYRKLQVRDPSFGFGSGNRGDSSTSKLKRIPGPGSYALPNLIGKDGPSKTMGGVNRYSPELKEQLRKPGPGAYDGDVLKTRKQDPQYKLGTGKRIDHDFNRKLKFTADPGAYDPRDEFTKIGASKWGFGTEKRNREDKGA